MPAAKKRASGATTASQPKAKAAKKVDPVVVKCDAVNALMETAEGYPQQVITMLTSTVKTTLGVAKGERHEMQSNVVKMIGEVLSSVETKLQEKLEALKAKLAEADAEKATRASAAEAADATAKAKGESLDAAFAAVEAGKKAIADALKALKAAEKEQKDGDAELVKAEKSKTALEAAMNDQFKNLKEGCPADAAKQIKALTKVCKDHGFEAQLVVSSEAALLKQPDSRGSFDNVVVTQLEAAFTEAIGKLTEQLSAGEAGKAERAAKVEAAKAALEAAQTAETAREEEMSSASKASAEAHAAWMAAKKAVKDLGPEMKKANAAASEAEAELASCKTVLATYKELAEGMPEPAAEAAPEAADAVDAAAAEA